MNLMQYFQLTGTQWTVDRDVKYCSRNLDVNRLKVSFLLATKMSWRKALKTLPAKLLKLLLNMYMMIKKTLLFYSLAVVYIHFEGSQCH